MIVPTPAADVEAGALVLYDNQPCRAWPTSAGMALVHASLGVPVARVGWAHTLDAIVTTEQAIVTLVRAGLTVEILEDTRS